VNARRTIVSLYLFLFVAVVLTSGIFFWQTREEYNRLRDAEALSQRRLSELELRLKDQQKVLERLRTDPAYVERVIRRRLGYAKPDEFIFRFDE
jgi:cell division protein DivIC